MKKNSRCVRGWQKAVLAAFLAVGVAWAGTGAMPVYAKAEAAEGVQKKISRISVNTKTVALKKAGTQQLVLTAVYTDKTTEEVTALAEWSSADSEIATVEAGLVTATGTGKTKIKASYGGKSVTVPVEIEVIGKLTVDQKKIALTSKATKQITATATYSDKTTASVTDEAKWLSANKDVVTVEKGLVTAVGPGKTKVTVSCGGKTVSIPVEVDVIAKLQLDAKKVYVHPGKTQTLKLSAFLSNGERIDATALAEWSSSDEKVVTVAAGVVTGVGFGKAKITAKYAGKTVTIPVEAAVVSSLETDARSVTLKVGETKDVKATVTYTDETKAEVTSEADWTSVNQKVATVEAGKITAVKAGKTTVIATYNGKLVNVQVTVK
ncbi:Ig domain-containing protein [Brevibacillus sp. GCM10020057]|uniref:Ig-like domain-containing protein n=1 Tax=Brevibacillus sp. GCM10020057 TaxID=3317327 RepID=UPI00363FECFA